MSTIKDLHLIIYQNTYFTDSLISIIEEGLTDIEKEKLNNESKKDVGLEAKAESQSILGLLPFIGHLQAKGNLNFSNFRSLEQDKKITDSYRFSKIKEYILKEKITCTEIDDKINFDELKLGQFVEFTSNYKKNEIRELIDMLLNDNSFDLLWLFWQTAEKNKNAKEQIEIASPINNKQNNKKSTPLKDNDKEKENFRKIFNDFREVLNADFPKETATLDFYGQIKDASTRKDTEISNFLICDTKFFVQEDKNRILDGKFRVFGKIIDIQDKFEIESENSIEKAFSQLDRNKFFKRTKKEAIKGLEKWIKDLISSVQNNEKKWFDSQLDFVVEGKAIKVLPIVIYI